MKRKIVKRVVKGTLRLVETVKYTNGTIVERLLNSKTLVPETILTASAPVKVTNG